MIEYGLSNPQLNELERFSRIFNKDKNQFVLDCILLILCEWNEDRDNFIRIELDIDEIDLYIELTEEIEDELYDLSDYHDLSIRDCVSGIVGSILHYLDLNWNGTYGSESDEMTDKEKLIELIRENSNGENQCLINFSKNL